ncbi:MAG: hypothetical protein ACKVYV_07165 [Limisphaerales bacterium]
MNIKSVSAIAAVLTAAATSHAYVLIGAAPTVTGSGPYTYTYALAIDSGSLVGAANPAASQFALWDIHGYILGSGGIVTPASSPAFDALFTTVEALSLPPASPSIIDDPLLYDLGFLYTGAPITDPFGGAALPFGDLVFKSTFGPGVYNDGSNFQSLTEKPPAGNIEYNTLTALVPTPIPETSTVVSGIAIGLLGAGYVLRRRMTA